MFRKNEIRKTTKHAEFLEDLKTVLKKHRVTMIYGEHHIEFHKEDSPKFAQCYCVNGGSKID